MIIFYPAIVSVLGSLLVWLLNYFLITRKDRKQAEETQKKLELKLELQRQEDRDVAEKWRKEEHKLLLEKANQNDFRSSLAMYAEIGTEGSQEFSVWNGEKVFIYPVSAVFYQGYPHEVNILCFNRGNLMISGTDYDYNRSDMNKIEKSVELSKLKKMFFIPIFDKDIKEDKIQTASYFLFKDFSGQKKIYMHHLIVYANLRVEQKLYSSLDLLIYKKNKSNIEIDDTEKEYWETFSELINNSSY